MSPLVSPCACRGGSKYVHLECLQQWAGTKDDEEQERQVAWKRGTAYVECITCKQEFFGETAVALGREALLRTTARHQRATAESADSFERTQLDMAESLTNLARKLQVRSSTTRRLIEPTKTIFSQAQGKLEEAEEPTRRALAIFETSLGTEHEKVAKLLNNLAQLLQVRGSTT